MFDAARLAELAWDKQDGLLPAIVQDARNLRVLMLGYMNREALAETLASGKVTFYSRSKQRLWTKGESSGHVLALQAIVTREVSPIEPALITVGAFRGGTAPNVISDEARVDITVRANTEATRAQLLKSIERVALNTARAAGVAEDLLPIVRVHDDGAPTTTNDAALARRVRVAIQAGMGEDAFVPWRQTDMGAEDFPDLVGIQPPIPSVYFEVGGTPPERLASGDWADSHSPLFRIDAEASIKAGVEAMTYAALAVLGKP